LLCLFTRFGQINVIFAYTKSLPFIVKRQKQTTERQRNFCCIKIKKKKPHRTFRHIWLCPTQKPTLRKAKRAFILPTHRQTVDYSNTFYIEKRDNENYLLFLCLNPTLATLKFQCIAIASYLVRHSRKTTLVMSVNDRRRAFFDELFQKIDNITPKSRFLLKKKFLMN